MLKIIGEGIKVERKLVPHVGRRKVKVSDIEAEVLSARKECHGARV